MTKQESLALIRAVISKYYSGGLENDGSESRFGIDGLRDDLNEFELSEEFDSFFDFLADRKAKNDAAWEKIEQEERLKTARETIIRKAQPHVLAVAVSLCHDLGGDGYLPSRVASCAIAEAAKTKGSSGLSGLQRIYAECTRDDVLSDTVQHRLDAMFGDSERRRAYEATFWPGYTA